jgi:hypothetical protein
MGMGKGMDTPKPKVAGMDEIDVPTNETNVPPSYFAGVRRLPISWMMVPLITKIKQSSAGGKK